MDMKLQTLFVLLEEVLREAMREDVVKQNLLADLPAEKGCVHLALLNISANLIA